MKEPVIRRARAGDLTALTGALGQDHLFVDWMDRQRRNLGDLFVAWVDDAPVGSVFLWRAQPFLVELRQNLGWHPTISHLEVRPEWRDLGIGTKLVRAAERRATRLGHWRICLGVDQENTGARRLYDRLGYADLGLGPVAMVWSEPGPDGCTVRRPIACDWLVKALPGDGPGDGDWQSWDPWEAANVLKESDVDWHVAGGRAIDLHLGRQTEHPDELEVAIVRSDFAAWRDHLAEYDFYDVGSGQRHRLDPAVDPEPNHFEVWVCDPEVRKCRMDTVLEERSADEWLCRSIPGVRVPLSQAIEHTPDGIPYLRPEYALLGMARRRRAKDEADLAAVLPTLNRRARRRLTAALHQSDPEHPWLQRVA